jgi:hypothetical protein
MSGDAEYGPCGICGRETTLVRKYYRYDIKCDCCTPRHFQFVSHCSGCEPKPPETTTVSIKPMEEDDATREKS